MRRRILMTVGAVALVAAPQAAAATARPAAERAVQEVRAAKRGEASAPSVAVATRNLALAVDGLRGSERRSAERLLARPTDPGGDGYVEYAVTEAAPACGVRFCVHYVTSGVDAPDPTDVEDAEGEAVAGGNGVPDFIDLMLREFEFVGRRENSPAPTGLGWPNPVNDGRKGGDGRFDVYVAEIAADGIYGYANFEPASDPTSHSLPAYMAMDNSYSEFGYPDPRIPLDVTAAHEYNHVLQGAIDARFDVWFAEATATWMEDQVFPEGNDWQLYLARWGQNPQLPITTFDLASNAPTNIRVYGSSVFLHWLSDQYGPAAVRDAWRRLPLRTPAMYSPGALDDALTAAGGTSTSDAFGRFAAATAEWQLPESGIHDAGQFTARVRRESTQLTDGSTVSAPLDHLAFRLYDVAPQGDGPARLTLTAPAGTAANVALVGRRGADATGTLEIRQVRLPAGGTATVTLPEPGSFSRITAVVANSDTRVDPSSPFDARNGLFAWRYRGDGGTFTASLSTAATPTTAEPTPVTPSPVVVATPAPTVVVPPAAATPAAPATPLPLATGAASAADVRSAVRSARDAAVAALGDRRSGSLRSRARTFAFDAPAAGRLTVSVAAGGRTLGRGATSTTRARLLTGRVALTATGVRALRADRRIRASVTVRFVPRSGATVTVRRKVTLTR